VCAVCAVRVPRSEKPSAGLTTPSLTALMKFRETAFVGILLNIDSRRFI
jgi:hypothetical protein